MSAIHVIQTEMGIAGTTALEASNTISGSLASVKAQWQNLLVAISQGDGWDIGAYVSNFVDTLTTAFDNLMPVISGALVGIGELITQLAPIIGSKLPGLVGELLPQFLSAASSLMQSVVEALPELIKILTDSLPLVVDMIVANQVIFFDAGFQLLTAIINGIVDNIPVLIDAALGMLQQMVDSLIRNLPLLLEAGMSLLMGIIDGILSAIPRLVEMLPTIIEQIVTTLLSMINDMLTTGNELLTGIIDGIVAAIPLLVDMLPTIINTVVDVLLNNLPLVVNTGIELLIAVIDGILAAIPQLIAMLPTIITTIVRTLTNNLPKILEMGKQILSSLVNGIKSVISRLLSVAGDIVTGVVKKIGELPGKMLNIGKNLVKGIWDGISSSFTWIKNKISGWVGNVLSFIKNLFGIHSPSTETAWMGEMMSEGLAKGILANAPAALKAVDKLGDKVSGRFGSLTAEISGLSTSGSGLRMPAVATGAIIPPMAMQYAFAGAAAGNAAVDPNEITSMVRDAVAQGLSANNQNNTYRFVAQIDGRTLFDKMIKEGRFRQMSTGRNPFEF